MALITCPKCGKQFSEHAEACPACGLQQSDFDAFLEEQQRKLEEERQRIEEEQRRLEEEERIRREKRQEWWKENKKKVLIVCSILIGVVILIYVAQILNQKHINNVASDLILRGDSLANEYQFDEAQDCYKEVMSSKAEDDIQYEAECKLRQITRKSNLAKEEYQECLRKLKVLLEADDYEFNQYSNECLDKMIKIAPNAPETKYYQNLRNK